MTANKLTFEHECPVCILGYGSKDIQDCRVNNDNQTITLHIAFECSDCFNAWTQTVVVAIGEIKFNEVEIWT